MNSVQLRVVCQKPEHNVRGGAARPKRGTQEVTIWKEKLQLFAFIAFQLNDKYPHCCKPLLLSLGRQMNGRSVYAPPGRSKARRDKWIYTQILASLRTESSDGFSNGSHEQTIEFEPSMFVNISSEEPKVFRHSQQMPPL